MPLIDGATVRLPRLIGESHAADMIINGREVPATEAHEFGLVNRLVENGAALVLGSMLAALPQRSLRSDLRSLHVRHGLPLADALSAVRGTKIVRWGDSGHRSATDFVGLEVIGQDMAISWGAGGETFKVLLVSDELVERSRVVALDVA